MTTPPHLNAPKKRQRFRTPLSAAAILSATVLTACSGTSGLISTEPVADRQPADGPQSGGIIEYGHLQEPKCVYGGWIQENFTARQVLDSLVSQDAEGEIVPWLATDWEVSEDQLVWTLTLRDEVSFTDGTPVDAEAVAYNFDHWLDGGNGTAAAHLGGFYEDSSAVDEHTVEIHLSAPFSPFLSTLSQSYFGIQSPTALETRSEEENCRAPIGSGPFTVQAWESGQYLEFVRNEDYNSAPANAKHQGPAYVEGIRWSFIPDNTSRYGSLLSEESDVIGEVPAVNIAQARERFDFEQYITPGRPVVINLNTEKGVFADQQVRQALSFATDREANIESAFLGTVPFEPSGYLSQSTPDYDVDAATEYPFDLDRADELLDEAGWTERAEDGTRLKGGERLEVLFTYGLNTIVTPDGNTAIQNFQEQARDAGFDIQLRPLTPSENSSGAFSGPDAYDAQVGYWTSPHAGILNINYRPGTEDQPNGANTTFLADEGVFATIQEALQAPTSEDVTKHFAQAQHELSELAPAIGLYTQTNTIAVSDELSDVWLEESQGSPVFHDAYFVAEESVTEEEG
ncbi:ABC transporter substrate-binding protein [Nesterenkonia aurantiaca]|uniref:ABC transporter substrate-binding protein n=1 Tax=Nesterenkonia aurantiaca TaxID=1436010 RepID=UPI003EE49C10